MASSVSAVGALAPPALLEHGHVQRIAILDFWRFVSISIVIICHLSINPLWRGRFGIEFIEATQGLAKIGVFFFFFISGYVVSKAAFAEIAKQGNFSIKGFYIRRFFRITPPLTLYLLACWALGAAGLIDFGVWNFLASFFYLCNGVVPGSYCGWITGHTWSLAFEEQFYLVFPILLGAFVFDKPRKWFFAACMLAIFLMPLLFSRYWTATFFRVHALFLLGYVCARYDTRILAFLTGKTGVLTPIFLVAVFFPYAVVAPETVWYRLIILPAIAALVMCSLAAKGRILELVTAPWILYIGRMSYSVYLWQELATYQVPGNPSVLFDLGRIVCVFVLCVLLFEYFEKPMIKRGRACSEKYGRAKPASA